MKPCHMLAAGLFAATLLVASCSVNPETAGAENTVRIVNGDTINVRHLGSMGTWETPMTFVEELSIGVLEGEEELMFGRIQDIAVDAEGGIYAFDGQVPALRYFDADGNYIRTLGGEGQGPGEYQDASLGLAVRTDGRIAMRDPRNRRLNVYNPDGSYSTDWTVNSGLFTDESTFIDQNDHLYLKIITGRPERNKPWPIALLHLDAEAAIVDTLTPPAISGEPEEAGGIYTPKKIWTWSPLGYMVAGINGSYAFTLFLPDGKILNVERNHEVVEFLSEERAEIEKWNDWFRENQGRFMTSEIPPVPNIKPVYKGLKVDDDGRIWVHLHTTVIKKEKEEEPSSREEGRPPERLWEEPSLYDVFEPDGIYLGEVQMPRGFELEIIRGDQAWGIKRGELGEQYIVRMSLQAVESEVL